MARKKIGKILSGGVIVLCVVLFCTVNISVQAFEGTVIKYTISGSTGVSEVTMKGLKDASGLPVTTDSSGYYSATVDFGWKGTVTPEKEGYRFEPSSKTYPPVTADITEHYTPTAITYTVAGKVTMDDAPMAGVEMSGLPGTPVTGADGTYIATVSYGWDGTVIPMKEGHDFKPPSRGYPPVKMNQTRHDYAGEPKMLLIAGSIGVAGVTLDGLPGNPKTDENGNYEIKVPYDWTGTVTPKLDGYEFNPPYMDYANIIDTQPRQDYVPTALTFIISGTTTVDGAELKGLEDISGQPVISDMSGYYSATVKYGFSGTVEPTKPGYTFKPASVIYTQAKRDRMDENYEAELKKLTLSGTIRGMEGVELNGLPGVFTGKDGTYSATVDYGWTGVVTPIQEGYTFTPESKPYPALTKDMPNQNYTAAKQQFTISGSTMVPGVQVKVVPGRTVTSGPDATYTATVDYGWKGTITPVKEGYEFDPPSRPYDNVMMSEMNQGFQATLQKMTIAGRIISDKQEPVADIYVLAEPGGITAPTNANGEYELEVDYRWRGRVTPTREGYNFRPTSKSYPMMTRDQANQNYTAVVQTFTIRDSVVINGTPIPGVTITATDDQGRTTDTATTDAKGQFVLTIPYDWSGEITPTKAGLRFNPPSQSYTNITTNMKEGAPEIVAPPTPTPPTAPPAGVPTPTPTAPPAGIPTPTPPTAPPAGIPTPTPPTAPPAEIPTPTPAPTVTGGLITNIFSDSDLITEVLPALSAASGKTIIADDTVDALINCELRGVPLETALEIVLAGTPYITKETPYYILVCSGGVRDTKFPVVAETKRLRLNYVTAQAAVGLLSTAFTDYVKAETGPAGTDTYTVVVTAPPTLKERIIEDLGKIDRIPAQVLLDARIVVMEKGDLLNLGVEWNWPTFRAGVFGGDNYGVGDPTFDYGGNWPWGVQIGYSPDLTFTNALEMSLNLLIENSQASILAKQQILGQDGKEAQIQVMQEEYYMLTPPVERGGIYAYTRSELATIEAGTTLTITPHVGDNNDITLQISLEVSDSIPRGRGSELPVVTRRKADNNVTIQDGGTVALAGLTENRTRSSHKRVPGLSRLPLVGTLFKNADDDNSSREIAVFITAHLVRQNGRPTTFESGQPAPAVRAPTMPTGGDFREDLRRSLSRPIR